MRVPSQLTVYHLLVVLFLHPVSECRTLDKARSQDTCPSRGQPSEPRLFRERDTRRAKEGPGERRTGASTSRDHVMEYVHVV
jgi:hypothetical protein